MNKRLRKKKHRGEFTEWGRQLVVTLKTSQQTDAVQDAFILEAIEANGWYCGGGFYEDKIDVVVELGKMFDDPEGRFARVTAWLDARPEVEGWKAGPLFDLWHGDFHDKEEWGE
jgi:uncharacterized protein YggL (DUF469 family)